jgi:hypothetical protein
MPVLNFFQQFDICFNFGTYDTHHEAIHKMFFAPMLAWESFPGLRNNVYKNILSNALLPPKLFHLKLVNTRLIFSQVTQKGPLNSFLF